MKKFTVVQDWRGTGPESTTFKTKTEALAYMKRYQGLQYTGTFGLRSQWLKEDARKVNK